MHNTTAKTCELIPECLTKTGGFEPLIDSHFQHRELLFPRMCGAMRLSPVATRSASRARNTLKPGFAPRAE